MLTQVKNAGLSHHTARQGMPFIVASKTTQYGKRAYAMHMYAAQGFRTWMSPGHCLLSTSEVSCSPSVPFHI